MKDLVIKHNGDVIYRGTDIFDVNVELPVTEFHSKLVEVCQTKLGMKFDHYMDEFTIFDNLMDVDHHGITVTNEEHDQTKINTYLYE